MTPSKIFVWAILVIFWLNTFGLLIAIISPYIDPTAFWLPAFIGLLFKVFIAGELFCLLIFLLAKKWTFFILSLLCLLLALPAISRNIAMGHSTKANPNGQRLRILTYNIKGLSYCSIYERTAARKIERHIVRLDPDIVCLQELSFVNSCQLLVKNIQKDIGLSYFYTDFNYNYNSKPPHTGNGQIILSRYPLFHYKNIFSEKTTSNGAFSVDMNFHGDTITIINTHFQSIGLTKEESGQEAMPQDSQLQTYRDGIVKIRNAFEKRGIQVERVKAAIQKLSHPLILCGDFNDTPISYTYYQLSDNLWDTWLKAGGGLGTTYAGALPWLRIDYILVAKKFPIRYAKVLHWPESDHYAYVAEIGSGKH